jgi:hypothetical protein
MRFTPSAALLAALACLLAPAPADAGSVRCEMRFDLSGWSAFYKRSSGLGTITCSNGQSLPVALEARGGGLSFGRSTIKDGIGRFSGVDDIRELLGGYATAEAHAGAGRAAKGQVVTKGPISLALSGTGEGWNLGVAFGSFIISER